MLKKTLGLVDIASQQSATCKSTRYSRGDLIGSPHSVIGSTLAYKMLPLLKITVGLLFISNQVQAINILDATSEGIEIVDTQGIDVRATSYTATLNTDTMFQLAAERNHQLVIEDYTSSSSAIDAPLDLSVNNTRLFFDLHNDSALTVRSNITGGSLSISRDFFSMPGEFSLLSLEADITNTNLNVQGRGITQQPGVNSIITIGDANTIGINNTYLHQYEGHSELVSRGALFQVRGIVNQLGESSQVDVHSGVLLLEGVGAYNLEKGVLNANGLLLIGGSTSFTQHAGTTVNIRTSSLDTDNWIGTLGNFNGDIEGNGTYNMLGGQLNSGRGLGGIQINYVDGGINQRDDDLSVYQGGLLNSNLTIDSGEWFGARNFLIGQDQSNTGHIVIEGGISRTYANMAISSGSSVQLNTGRNFVNGQLAIQNGQYTQNGGYTEAGNLYLSGNTVFQMNGGNLEVDNIANLETVGNKFQYTDGGVKINGQQLAINQSGLLGGSALTIDTGERFGGLSVRVGSDDVNEQVSVVQNDGSMIVTNELRIEANGAYVLNGGELEAGSFAGNGKLTFNSGELTVNSALGLGQNSVLGSILVIGDDTRLVLADDRYESNRFDLTIDSDASITIDDSYSGSGNIVANRIINNGSLDFQRGSLRINHLTVGEIGALGNSLRTSSNQGIYIDQTLTIDQGGVVHLGGTENIINAEGVVTAIESREGDIRGNADINNAGTILLENSGSIEGNELVNSGRITLDGGNLDVDSISNTGGGTFAFNAGKLNVDQLSVGDNGLLGGNVNSSSGREVNASNLAVDSGASLTISSGRTDTNTITSSGSVTVASGATIATNQMTQNQGALEVNGIVLGDVDLEGGSLSGSGRINGDLAVNSGAVNPGNSPGQLEVSGDFTMTTGQITMEVEKVEDEFAIDQLFVAGDYHLDGGDIRFLLDDGMDIDTFIALYLFDDFFKVGAGSSSIGLLESGYDHRLLAALDIRAWDIATQTGVLLGVNSNGSFVSAVPVPAAMWLFGSALIGLVGIKRNR